MAKNGKSKVAEEVPIQVTAQTDPNAITTEAEVTKVEIAELDGKEVEVLTIDETPKIVLSNTSETIFVRLRDGGSCWGAGKTFISGSEIKQFPKSPFVMDGINHGALIECDEQGKPQ